MLRDTIHKCRDIQRKKQKKKRHEEAQLRARVKKMHQFKHRIVQLQAIKRRGKKGEHDQILAEFAHFIDIDDIESLELDEFEHMIEQI